MSKKVRWQNPLRRLGDLILRHAQVSHMLCIQGDEDAPPRRMIPERHVDGLSTLAHDAQRTLEEAGVELGLPDDPDPICNALRLVNDLVRQIEQNRRVWKQMQSKGQRLKGVEGNPLELDLLPREYAEAFLAAIECDKTDLHADSDSAQSSDQSQSARTGGYFSAAELATRHKVPAQALRKRLESWRHKHVASDDFTEQNSPRRNQARFRYRESAVLHIIEDLRAKEANRQARSKPRS